MTAIKAKYSPSANIERDIEAPIKYVPTPNTKQIYSEIIADFANSNRAFNIIGSYGTGKSSFLIALYQTINGINDYFPEAVKLTRSFGHVQFVGMIGDYTSMTESFAKRFKVASNKSFKVTDLLDAIKNTCRAEKKRKRKTIIAIDEFGKFLEFASKNNPEQELYFIQQLAELSNDERNDLLLITTLHQDFSAYAFDLTKSQRNEWDKVKGRLKEITFNEPVEQLLYLAAERLADWPSKVIPRDFDKLINCISDARVFPLKDFLNKDTAQKLYPFDILGAAVLTLALQRYGQNERSLFSFLESNDHLGIKEFDISNERFYNLSCVYDYLSHNFYSFLNSRNNPHYLEWNLLRKSIAIVEGISSLTVRQQSDAVSLVKVIGLLNIFSSPASRISKQFLRDYMKIALSTKGSEDIIEVLVRHKVIRYVNYSHRYILFEGTDIDIELAIDQAGNLVEGVSNVVQHLKQNFEFPFLMAKRNFFETGTPRFFQFLITDKPANHIPEDEVDGFINLIFSNEVSAREIRSFSANNEEAILYGYFKNTKEIQKILLEIQKVSKVMDQNPDDRVAIRELKGILHHQRNLLNHAVMDSFYDPDVVSWYFRDRLVNIPSRTRLNQVLSEICDTVYNSTPKFKNEMVNKTKLSSQIITARRNLVSALLEKPEEEGIGFNNDQFPPEKTIYLSLLRETGIHALRNGFWQLATPRDESFSYLWQVGEDFIAGAKYDRQSLEDFVEVLLKRPLKLKRGFLDFWLCLFLIVKRDEFALYDDEGYYVPEITSEVLDLLLRRPGNFSIKSFNITGINKSLFQKYRVFINQSTDVKVSNKSFIDTIKPFLVFYKKLNTYGQKTKSIGPRAQALREAISSATDPETAFFVDFPTALGYSLPALKAEERLAETFIGDLQKNIREIQNSYSEMLTRFESTIKNTLGQQEPFPHYRDALRERYAKLKVHMLTNEQKSFYERIKSSIDDRDSYLASFGQVCVGKSLEMISDEEEGRLHSRFGEFVLAFDTLTEISTTDVDENNEDVVLFQLTSFVKGLSRRTLRIPKTQRKEMDVIVAKMKHLLGEDTRTNLAIIVRLLQQELENEK